jgi:TonB family protein
MRFLPALGLLLLLLSAPLQAQEPPPQPAQDAPPSNAATLARIRLGGNVAAAKLLNRVQPEYPPLARQTRISGTVRLHVILSTEGTVKEIAVVSGHPLLLQASLDAVRQWRYEPTLLSGQPVEVDSTIDVIFALNQDKAAPESSDTGPSPQLRADILRLFEVIHFKENATNGGRQIFESLRPALLSSLPDTPRRERITDAYIEKLLGLVQSDAYTDRVIAIYVQYFSDQDVQELVRFYQTPTGQHFNTVMPQLLGDLNQIGQQLAMENLPGIYRQLCKEFPELQDDARFFKEPDPQQKSQLAAPEGAFAKAARASTAQDD